ncbi:hypothetical protein pb186bvf_005706 [Paramecium bursaria]
MISLLNKFIGIKRPLEERNINLDIHTLNEVLQFIQEDGIYFTGEYRKLNERIESLENEKQMKEKQINFLTIKHEKDLDNIQQNHIKQMNAEKQNFESVVSSLQQELAEIQILNYQNKLDIDQLQQENRIFNSQVKDYKVQIQEKDAQYKQMQDYFEKKIKSLKSKSDNQMNELRAEMASQLLSSKLRKRFYNLQIMQLYKLTQQKLKFKPQIKFSDINIYQQTQILEKENFILKLQNDVNRLNLIKEQQNQHIEQLENQVQINTALIEQLVVKEQEYIKKIQQQSEQLSKLDLQFKKFKDLYLNLRGQQIQIYQLSQKDDDNQIHKKSKEITEQNFVQYKKIQSLLDQNLLLQEEIISLKQDNSNYRYDLELTQRKLQRTIEEHKEEKNQEINFYQRQASNYEKVVDYVYQNRKDYQEVIQDLKEEIQVDLRNEYIFIQNQKSRELHKPDPEKPLFILAEYATPIQSEISEENFKQKDKQQYRPKNFHKLKKIQKQQIQINNQQTQTDINDTIVSDIVTHKNIPELLYHLKYGKHAPQPLENKETQIEISKETKWCQTEQSFKMRIQFQIPQGTNYQPQQAQLIQQQVQTERHATQQSEKQNTQQSSSSVKDVRDEDRAKLIVQFEKDQQILRQQNVSQFQEINQLKEQNSIILQQSDVLNKQIHQLNSKIQSLQGLLISSKYELNQEIIDQKSEFDLIQNETLRKHSRQVIELNRQMETLNQDIWSRQSQIDKLKKEGEELQKLRTQEINQLKKQLNDKEEEKQQLIQSYSSIINLQEIQKQEYEDKIKQFNEQIEQLKLQIQQQPSKIEDVEEIQRLRSQIQDQEKQMSLNNDQLKHANQIVKYMTLELENYKKQYNIFSHRPQRAQRYSQNSLNDIDGIKKINFRELIIDDESQFDIGYVDELPNIPATSNKQINPRKSLKVADFEIKKHQQQKQFFRPKVSQRNQREKPDYQKSLHINPQSIKPKDQYSN